MTHSQDSTAKGVFDAFAFWLEQHALGLGEVIEKAVREGSQKALSTWVWRHTDDILEGIVRVIASSAKSSHPDAGDNWYHRSPCCGPCRDCGSDQGCLVYNDDIHPQIHTCATGCQCPPECDIHHGSGSSR